MNNLQNSNHKYKTGNLFVLLIGNIKKSVIRINNSISSRKSILVPYCLLLAPLLLFFFSCSTEKLKIEKTLCENKVNPIGVSTNGLHFSWIAQCTENNAKQTAYQIMVASSPDSLNANHVNIWDSKKVESNQSIFVSMPNINLTSATCYYYKVKIWDNKGNESSWSQINHFETGLTQQKDWGNAQWIAMDEMDSTQRIVPGIHAPNYSKIWKKKESGLHKLPLLRKEFTVSGEISSAYLFISGLGHYELDMNGKKVGNSYLAAGWTNYDSTCFYNSYNITKELNKGKNAIGVWLGNGFYNIPNQRYRKLLIAYGNPKMICKLVINYKDGHKETIVSDTNWKTHASPITFSSIYAGEDYNANLEQKGWNNINFDDSNWKNAVVSDNHPPHLLSEMDYPVAIMQTIPGKSVTTLDSINHTFVYDFKQNASGIIHVKLKGNKGDTVTFIPGELINEEGKVIQGATGKPYYFTYIMKGNGEEEWTPKFTYYGFRYVQVEGAEPHQNNENIPQIISLDLLHTRNSSPETGEFSSSFPLFNQVNSLIKWAIESNMQSVLTDCPHREKLGWLEQSYLMGGGIHYNFDIYHLYCKMIQDMIDAQTSEGLIPAIAPEYTIFDFANGDFRDSPEWGSASIILPWLMYKWYGDRDQMQKAWPMMVKYVTYLRQKANNNILDHGLGDWYDLGPNSPGYAQLTPRSLTATAIYYYDISLLKEMAKLLHKSKDEKYFTSLASEIKDSFNSRFYNPETHIYSTGSQTAIAMPLVLGLVNKKNKDKVFLTLVKSVQNSDYQLTAGDIGFHFLIKALQDGNAGDIIYKMNARDDVPGYGFQIKKGATALTESWQALKRVSNNHLMLGHIMEWFYEGLGGIQQEKNSIAYKALKIEPQMPDSLKKNDVSFLSPYGLIQSKWVKTNTQETTLEVKIPFNTGANIYIPTTSVNRVLINNKPLKNNTDITIIGFSNGKLNIKVGSGEYLFRIIKP